MSRNIDEIRADLIELSGVSVGVGNAKEVMRKYQIILLGVIDVVKDLCKGEVKDG
jgi:hypothetical protein